MRVLIVDDEAPARRRLRAMLELVPNADALEIVGEADSGASALEMAAATCPDLVILDVQMPGLDGFAVARALAREEPARALVSAPAPEIVFSTAFEAHAVRAFDLHAVDYLLKPYTMARLQVAIERAQARRSRAAARSSDGSIVPGGMEAVLAAWERGELGQRRFPARFAVRVGERIYYVRAESIDWVEADGNYVRLHTGISTPKERTHLIRKSMAAMAAELDPMRFARVHRSTIVNVDRIHELRHIADGEYLLLLLDGTKLRVSRTYRQNLPDF
jgi:two-component system LytT family response regulator